MEKGEQYKRSVMLTVLSLSLIISGSNAVSGAIPLMQRHFSNMPTTAVELIVTIPSFASIFVPLLSGYIQKGIGKRSLSLIGLGLAIIGGLLPVFVISYIPVILSRILLGVGLSLFTPLTVSYILDLYDKDESNNLLGYRNAVMSLGDTAMLLIVGVLLKISWHLTFGVFLTLLIPFSMILFFMPKKFDHYSIMSKSGEVKAKQRTNLAIIIYALIFLVITLAYSTIFIKLADYIVNNHIGDASAASFVFSVLTATSIVAGIAYKYIFKLLKAYTTAISAIIAGISLIIALLNQSLTWMVVFIVIAGFFWGILNPHLTSMMADQSPEGSVTLSTSIIVMGINLAYLISPYYNAFVSKLFHNFSSGFSLTFAGVVWTIFGIIYLIYIYFSQKQKSIS
ncbi:MFS transporter [Lentilactobacillus kisonensis]|uniref:Transporter, major facilitator family protein n=1 Tax=Lentilactobacillus kisonensis F0435 TaxID=797516 RepID=H1LFR2_9LACO|nr:MFS transporter [Lentilactobacillus kisonensis]EHO51504.1 transporter, major facilitator family protein [Lentilactobacillus kisonensis F0435]